jgi:hypothetical protein
MCYTDNSCGVVRQETGNSERQRCRNFYEEGFYEKEKSVMGLWVLATGGALWFAGCGAMMEMLGFGSVAEANAEEVDTIIFSGEGEDG